MTKACGESFVRFLAKTLGQKHYVVPSLPFWVISHEKLEVNTMTMGFSQS